MSESKQTQKTIDIELLKKKINDIETPDFKYRDYAFGYIAALHAVLALLDKEENIDKNEDELKKRTYGSMYITMLDKPDPKKHRSKIIIHKSSGFFFAEFNTWQQLQDFLGFTGLKIDLIDVREYYKPECGRWRKYIVNKLLDDSNSFWDLSEVPKEAKKIKGHSNGSLVDCYILNDGDVLHVYRPNPNARAVYQPLPLEEHIAYKKEHGGF